MAEVVNEANCPRDTMVGAATLIVNASTAGVRLVITVPVFNIAPAPGEPLAFAFDALFFPVRIDTSVLSDGEYNARVTVPDITGGAATYMSSITIWGDPAEHNGPGPDAAARNIEGHGFLENGEVLPQISFGGPGVEEFEQRASSKRNRVREACAVVDEPDAVLDAVDGELGNGFLGSAGNFAGVRGRLKPSMGTATGCGQLSFKPRCLDAARYAGSGRPGRLFVGFECAAEHRSGRPWRPRM